MRFSLKLSLLTIGLIASPRLVEGGPIAYGLCQTGEYLFVSATRLLKVDLSHITGCNTVAVACYAAAGATFGTVVAAAAAPAVILGCNAALGTCSATCATVALFAPIP